MKACSKCETVKPLVDFHNNSFSKDGKKSSCKECIRIDSKKYYQTNKELILTKGRKYYVNNKEKVDCANLLWAKNNKEKVRAIHRKWVEKNPDRNCAHKKSWILRNPEKKKEATRKHRKNNLPMYAEKSMRRYASKLNATPLWADIDAIKDVYKEAEYFQMQVDHVVPLKGKNVCGLHVWDNLQLLTAEENQKKSNKFNIEAAA